MMPENSGLSDIAVKLFKFLKGSEQPGEFTKLDTRHPAWVICGDCGPHLTDRHNTCPKCAGPAQSLKNQILSSKGKQDGDVHQMSEE